MFVHVGTCSSDPRTDAVRHAPPSKNIWGGRYGGVSWPSVCTQRISDYGECSVSVSPLIASCSAAIHHTAVLVAAHDGKVSRRSRLSCRTWPAGWNPQPVRHRPLRMKPDADAAAGPHQSEHFVGSR